MNPLSFLKFSTVQFVCCHARVVLNNYYSFFYYFLYKKIHLTNLSLKFQSYVAPNDLDFVLPALSFRLYTSLNNWNFRCTKQAARLLIITFSFCLCELLFIAPIVVLCFCCHFNAFIFISFSLSFNTAQSIGTLVFQCFFLSSLLKFNYLYLINSRFQFAPRQTYRTKPKKTQRKEWWPHFGEECRIV